MDATCATDTVIFPFVVRNELLWWFSDEGLRRRSDLDVENCLDRVRVCERGNIYLNYQERSLFNLLQLESSA